MQFTYLGHSCFQVKTNHKTLLFDPFISPNPLAENIDVDAVEADFMLISHGHEDHIADAVSIAKRTDCNIVSTYEIIGWLSEQGCLNGHPMNHGGQWQFDFGQAKMVNAVHSSVLPDGTYGGNPAGFVINNDEGCFYYAGDTALTMDMKLIPFTSPKLDFAVLPIGDNFTMGIEDAVMAAEFVQCETVIGVHYDTFGFVEIDKEAAKAAFDKAGIKLLLPKVGETISL